MDRSETIKHLGKMLFDDLSLVQRSSGGAFRTSSIDIIADAAMRLIQGIETHYTAFDGDHHMLCGLMRRNILGGCAIPVNTESILGYRDTLAFHQNKRGVLFDDITLLRKCDRLILFSDGPIDRVCDLAEGVILELLVFSKLKRLPIKLVPISGLVMGDSVPVEIVKSYDELIDGLAVNQRAQLQRLCSQADDQGSRRLIYGYAVDPLDHKYASFIRPRAYAKGVIPLLPMLGLRPEDYCSEYQNRAGELVLGWLKLVSMSDELLVMEPLDKNRAPSGIVSLLERVWSKVSNGRATGKSKSWFEFGVPKAKQEEKWPLTTRERDAWARGR